jgi:hypothetical protein
VKLRGAWTGEDLNRDDHGRNQISKCDPNPHEGARTLLILERRQAEQLSLRGIAGIDKSTTEHKECGKNVTGQRGQE